MGKIHPSPRIVYVLFTKADFANKKMRLSAHIKEGWALYARPIELLIFVLAQWQKEGFSHQLHSEPEAVGKGIVFGDAVHLVHAILKLFQRFLLLFRECSVQFFAVPGDQLQQFLEPLVTSSALLEGRDVSIPECVKCFHQNLRIQKR